MTTFTQPLRHLASCDRGSEERRPILGLPRLPRAPSTLQLRFASGLECSMQLAPRHTALILAAVDAWHADEGELETLRGFRTAAELGQHYAKFSHTGASIRKQTVQAYAHEIRAHVAKEVSSLFPRKGIPIRAPRLLEGRRVLGYRIDKNGLEIVQARARQASDD